MSDRGVLGVIKFCSGPWKCKACSYFCTDVAGCVHTKVVGERGHGSEGLGNIAWLAARFWRGWIRNLPKLKKESVRRSGNDK